jgi:hypothetical protein
MKALMACRDCQTVVYVETDGQIALEPEGSRMVLRKCRALVIKRGRNIVLGEGECGGTLEKVPGHG